MKISKISIKNYRSCKATVFEPNADLTALIGPNGCGKTNTLSAIRLLKNLLDSGRFRGRVREEIPSTATEIKTWFVLDDKTIVHTAILAVATNERNEDEILDSSETWYMYDITGHKKKSGLPLGVVSDIYHTKSTRNPRKPQIEFVLDYLSKHDFNESALDAMLKVAEFIEKISYYSASQFTNPANSPISFEVEAERGSSHRRGISIRSTHKTFLYDMYMAYKEDGDDYREFFSIVGPEGIGIVESIDFKEINTSSSTVSVLVGGKIRTKERQNLLVVPGFKISSETLSPSQLSEGTFKTLALIFYLVTDKGSVLLIEEPEVCIHHGLLSSIIELIKVYSKEKQIFISTHSDAVLDRVDLENVFVVKKTPEAGTVVKNISRSLRKSEISALKDYLMTEGSLGEYWKHGDLEQDE